jgi:hypothetical protein
LCRDDDDLSTRDGRSKRFDLESIGLLAGVEGWSGPWICSRKRLRLTRFLKFVMYYVYVLHSEADHGLYIGFTADLAHRVLQYNEGESKIDLFSSSVSFNLLRSLCYR